jgi:hypothetical protein
MKNVKNYIEKVKNVVKKEENKKKIKACGAGLALGMAGFIGYKVGCMRAIGKITNEFYIILEGKNDLKEALKEAVEESI